MMTDEPSIADKREISAPVLPPKYHYRPELDALRFFAFLGTFAFHRMEFVHADPARDIWAWRIGTMGAFGVPVFFLLSAFLITQLLLRELAGTGRVHVGAFYMRRILRIWPLYVAAFAGLAVLNRVIPGVSTNDPLAWLAFALFCGQLVCHNQGLDRWAGRSFMEHLGRRAILPGDPVVGRSRRPAGVGLVQYRHAARLLCNGCRLRLAPQPRRPWRMDQ